MFRIPAAQLLAHLRVRAVPEAPQVARRLHGPAAGREELEEHRLAARTDAGELDGFPVGLSNYKGVSGANWGADLQAGHKSIVTDWKNIGTNGSFDGLAGLDADTRAILDPIRRLAIDAPIDADRLEINAVVTVE